MAEDMRYLITRGRIYWLQLATPRPLRDRLPYMIQKTLSTNNLREAQTLRWAWVNGYKRAWELAKANPAMTREEVEAVAQEEHARQETLEGRA